MKRVFASLAVAMALCTSLASAQVDPTTPALGTKLGIEELNTSGQVGSVTLFPTNGRAIVSVEMQGIPAGRVEAVRIFRSHNCDTVDPAIAYTLVNLREGRSRSLVNTSVERLLSGNYSIIVFSNTSSGARSVACGHLY